MVKTRMRCLTGIGVQNLEGHDIKGASPIEITNKANFQTFGTSPDFYPARNALQRQVDSSQLLGRTSIMFSIMFSMMFLIMFSWQKINQANMKRGTRNDPRNIGQNGDDELYRCLNSLDNKAVYRECKKPTILKKTKKTRVF